MNDKEKIKEALKKIDYLIGQRLLCEINKPTDILITDLKEIKEVLEK